MDTELCGDDFAYTVADFSLVEYDHYVEDRHGRYIFASELVPVDQDDMMDTLESILGWEEAKAIPEEKILQRFKELDWHEVILVHIEP